MDPAGIFSTSYRQDQSLIRTRNQAITLLLFIVALFALPMFAEVRSVAVMTSMLITAVVVLGLQINTGLAGQVNIGQAAFMGVGAYSTAVLASKLHLPFWLALPAGGVFAALFGVIFGLAAVRIKASTSRSPRLQRKSCFTSLCSTFRKNGWVAQTASPCSLRSCLASSLSRMLACITCVLWWR